MCGLLAYISKDNQWNALAKWKFQTLGVEMDSRGGDGCGIAFDGNVVKGIEPKKFDDFWRLDKVPDVLIDNAIIGHDRKASVGSLTLDNTQPIFFENLNTILAHNGTISNFREMYDSHKVKDHFDYDITGMSDSQVMGLLIEKSGWAVLEEYIGTMAFLYMRGDEPGVIYAYHGRSKNRRNVAAESEERPLYYAEEDGDVWMCSTREALGKIVKYKSCIKELPFNGVYRFDGKDMTLVYSVDRNKCYQMEDFIPARTAGYRSAYQSGSDEYSYEDYYMGAGVGSSSNLNYHNVSITKSVEDDKYLSKIANNIYWEGGYFKVNDQKLNGLVTVNSFGRLSDISPTNYNFYFWNGNLLKGENSYLNLLKELSRDEYCGTIKVKKMWVVGKYFAFPFLVHFESTSAKPLLYNTKMNTAGDNTTYIFTGTICVPFSSKVIRIDAGLYNSSTMEKYSGIADLAAYQVAAPKIDLVTEAIKNILSEGEEKKENSGDELFDCPICLGIGAQLSEGEEVECDACNGIGSLTRAELFAYMESNYTVTAALRRLLLTHDKSKVISSITKVIDRGIDILDISYADGDTSMLITQLNEIKMILWEKY